MAHLASAVSHVLRSPIPGHEFADAIGGMIRKAGQHVGEPSLWIGIVELGGGDKDVDRSRTPAPLIGAGEGPVPSSHSDRPDVGKRIRRLPALAKGKTRTGWLVELGLKAKK